jgi:DNA replication protein DnaC
MELAADIAVRVQQLFQRQGNTPDQDSSSPIVECEHCGDSGYILEKGCARECQCVAEKRVSFSLPARYRKASLLDFPQGTQQAVLDWLARPGDGLLLTGGVGTGKTHLAAAITRTLVMIRSQVMFRRCSELYAAVRETYRTNLDERTVLEKYLKPRMLVLDDLGAGSLSDHERRITLDVFDDRLNACLPTIATTNWSLEEIGQKMDDRIASRLSSFLEIELTGMDRREAGWATSGQNPVLESA